MNQVQIPLLLILSYLLIKHTNDIMTRKLRIRICLQRCLESFDLGIFFLNREIQSNGDVFIWASISKVVSAIVKEVFSQYAFAKKILQLKYVKNGTNGDKCMLKAKDEQIQYHLKSISDLLDILNWTINYNCDKKMSIG